LEVFFCEINEGVGDVGVVGNESSVEVGEAQEGAYVLDFGWGWPFGNAIELDRIHGELTWFDDHPEVFYLVGGEFAHLKFEVQVEFSHSLEDTLSVFLVSGGIGGEDEEVIHIDDKPSFSNHVSEGIVHKSSEGGGGVGEAEEHNGRFKEAFVGNKGGLPLMSIFDADVVVAPSDVKLSEDFCISEFVDEVGNQGKGIGVSNGVFVEIPVVLAWAKSSILLCDEEERGCLRGVGGADFPSAEIFVEEGFGSEVFVGGERV